MNFVEDVDYLESLFHSVDSHITLKYKNKDDASLGYGQSGLAIYSAYNYLYSKDDLNLSNLFYSLNSIIDDLEKKSSHHTFMLGQYGLIWALLKIKNLGLIDSTENQNLFNTETLKINIEHSINSNRDKKNNDFFNGLTGLLFFLNSLIKEDDEFIPLHELCIKYMMKISINDEKGIRWGFPTEEHYAKPLMDLYNKKNIVFFGLSHGITATSSVLSRALGTNNIHIILKTFKYLDSYKNINSKIEILPQCNLINYKKTEISNTWAHGNLAIAFAYISIGKKLNNRKLFNSGIEIAKESITRGYLFKSLDICSGIFGYLYVLYKLYKITHLEIFKIHANDVIKDMKKKSTPRSQLTNEIGILYGASGIGLSISTMLGKTDDDWDEFLLLS